MSRTLTLFAGIALALTSAVAVAQETLARTVQYHSQDIVPIRAKLTRPLAAFLAEQIAAGKTLLISGGTGTGKTTLLRILANAIPEQQRIVVIEDTSELHIQKPNILSVECQTDTFKSAVSFDDLLKSALRWRPDRIILGGAPSEGPGIYDSRRDRRKTR